MNRGAHSPEAACATKLPNRSLSEPFERAHVRAARYRILASRAPGRDDEAPIIARSDDARMAVALLGRAIDRYERG